MGMTHVPINKPPPLKRASHRTAASSNDRMAGERTKAATGEQRKPGDPAGRRDSRCGWNECLLALSEGMFWSFAAIVGKGTWLGFDSLVLPLSKVFHLSIWAESAGCCIKGS